MIVEVNYDNLYCLQCKREGRAWHMEELLEGVAYQCGCVLLCTDPVVAAQLASGWRRCDVCAGNGCEKCAHYGVFFTGGDEGA